MPTDVQQASVADTRRACCLASATSETAIQVQLSGAGRLGALEHLLDEIDAAARAVELISQELIGRTGCRAKPAVHAFAQDGIGLAARGSLEEGGTESGLHGYRSGYRRPRLKMPCWSNAAFRRFWTESMAGARGWNGPSGGFTGARYSVAWPPDRAARARKASPSCRPGSHLNEPPHSIRLVPGTGSGGECAGSARRQISPAAAKGSSCCSRTRSQ